MMEYTSIADIYEANERARKRLLAVLADITDEEANARPDGENWSIQQIAEHISMVDAGAARICAKLLASARETGGGSDGSFGLSEQLNEKFGQIANMKVEAPDRVRPTGEVSIEDSIKRLEASSAEIASLRDEFESCDLAGHTFPHPFFGELTAAEWLVVKGGHEARHTQQISRLLESIRN